MPEVPVITAHRRRVRIGQRHGWRLRFEPENENLADRSGRIRVKRGNGVSLEKAKLQVEKKNENEKGDDVLTGEASTGAEPGHGGRNRSDGSGTFLERFDAAVDGFEVTVLAFAFVHLSALYAWSPQGVGWAKWKGNFVSWLI